MARYLGIEVTDSQVKGVVLRTAYRKIAIEVVVRVARGPGLEGLTAAVQQVVAQAGPGIDASYAALPGTDASLRILELPRAVVRRGARVLATELEGSLPFDVEEATIDAQPIRQGETVELLAAAVRTDRVRAFIDALRAGGTDPREVGIGPIAMGELSTVIPELAVPGPVLVLHAYDTHADFTVLASGVVQMARTLGGQTTPEARMRGIRQTLSAYLAGGGKPPERAYLCGDAAYFNMDVVPAALGLPPDAVHMGLPLGTIEISPAVVPIEPQMAPLALALALRGLGRGARIDLRKGPLAITGSAQVLRERSWLIAGCVAAVLVSWGFATYARYLSIADERDRLRAALERVTLDTFGERIRDPRRARALALGTGGEAEQDPMPGADAFDVVGVLSSRIPDSIRHDIIQLDVAEERVQLQGLVDSLQHRDEIIEALRGYECFQNIQPGRVQRNPGDNRQQYTLDIELRCPERQQAGRRGAGGRAGGTGTSSGNRPTGGSSGSGI
jgi:general secretion pathway protein L